MTSREVNVLRQQVSTLRNGSRSATSPTSSKRSENSAYKIAMLGPAQSGKTKITSQIVGNQFPNKYEPTIGVRILELEETILLANSGEEHTQRIELWDCSGDQKFENCWTAICDKLDGIIVCFDPTNKSQANDVRIWCEWFCKRANLTNGQAVIFAHGELAGNHKPLSVRAGERTVVVPIVNVSTVNLPPPDEDGRPQPGPAKVEFQNFMNSVHEFYTNGEGSNGGGGASGGGDDY